MWDDARSHSPRIKGDIDICMHGWSETKIEELFKKATEHPEISDVSISEIRANHKHFVANVKAGTNVNEIEKFLEKTKRSLRNVHPTSKSV